MRFLQLLLASVPLVTLWVNCSQMPLDPDDRLEDQFEQTYSQVAPPAPVATEENPWIAPPPPEPAIPPPTSSRVRRAIASKDVLMGMTMDQVRMSWGKPHRVDIAGEDGTGNERWTYFTGLSSQWSMGSSRIIEFEFGRVAGWDTH